MSGISWHLLRALFRRRSSAVKIDTAWRFFDHPRPPRERGEKRGSTWDWIIRRLWPRWRAKRTAA
jgi:hypothetical protein